MSHRYWTCRKGEAAVKEPAGVSTTRRMPLPPPASETGGEGPRADRGGEGPLAARSSATASATAASSNTEFSALPCRRGGRPMEAAERWKQRGWH